jgi:glycine cleavage system H protein
MSNKIIEGLYYARTDEWLKAEEGIGTVGLSDYAQDQLGDIVYVESIEKGQKLKQGEAFTTIESVKAVSDMNAPVSGEVIEVNEAIAEDSSLLNSDPYGKGWIIKIKMENEEELKNLMTSADYAAYRKE